MSMKRLGSSAAWRAILLNNKIMSTQFEPKVAVEGRVCAFGECVRGLLLATRGISPEDAPQPMYVRANFSGSVLDLELSDSTGARFEHAPECPAMIFDKPQPGRAIRVGIATVLERHGRILLTQRHGQLRSFPNLWVVPGGHIEEGESLHETAQRELKEETGLSRDITVRDILGIWESTYPYMASLGPMTHHHAVCYLWAVQSSAEPLLVQTNEVQAIAWLSVSDVKAVLNRSKDTKVQVFTPQPIGQPSNGGENWHGDRTALNSNYTVQTAEDIYENITMGTFYALSLWLETQQQSEPKL